MLHSEFIIAAVLMCAAGLAFAAVGAGAGTSGGHGEPPRQETDTAWIERFLPPPDYEYQMEPEAFAELKGWVATDAFGEAQMRGALATMVDEPPTRRRHIARAALKEAGRRAEGMLLESIRDWRYPPPPEPSHSDSPHPWDFAAGRLARFGTRELVPILLAAQRDGRVPEGRRVNCVLFVAAVGSAESVEPTLHALRDPEERVRDYARIGIEWAMGDGHLGPEMRAAVFEPLLERAMAGTSDLSGEGMRTVLRVDRRRAIAALMNDRVLSPTNARLSDVLSAFTDPPPSHVLGPDERYDVIAVPPEKLWELWRHAEAAGLEPRRGSFAGSVLLALAVSDPEGVRPVAEDLLAGRGPLRGTAVSVLMRIENLPLGSEALGLWEAKSPGVRAPLPILYVDAVENVYLRQTLGGLSYFLEAYEDWRLAPEGFRAMGLPECAEAVEWVAAFYFGRAGPPEDMGERERVLMEREETEREERLIAAWEKTVEESAERAQLAIFRYMREHRGVFETLKPKVVPERP